MLLHIQMLSQILLQACSFITKPLGGLTLAKPDWSEEEEEARGTGPVVYMC